MKKEYKIVLVGCGLMGAAHMNDIYYRDNIIISGVVDIDPQKAQNFMKKYGAMSWSTDYTEYLKDPSNDIFIIATYPSTHLEILKNCLMHNKNVICEKPIANNIEDTQEFISMVKASKAKVLVGHILRHNITYNKVAQMIHKGAIGSPIMIRMVQNHHTKDWERYKKLLYNSSPIIDCGVHYIDIMHWFTGSRVTSVSGIGIRTEEDIPLGSYNYGMISLKFQNGSVAYYEAGWGNTIASGNVKEFIGPKGRIKVVYRRDRCTHQEEGDLIEYYSYPENEYRMINIDSKRKPTWEQLQHLINMIEGDIEAVPSIDEVYKSFEVVLAADKAIKSGRTIEIN